MLPLGEMPPNEYWGRTCLLGKDLHSCLLGKDLHSDFACHCCAGSQSTVFGTPLGPTSAVEVQIVSSGNLQVFYSQSY